MSALDRRILDACALLVARGLSPSRERVYGLVGDGRKVRAAFARLCDEGRVAAVRERPREPRRPARVDWGEAGDYAAKLRRVHRIARTVAQASRAVGRG